MKCSRQHPARGLRVLLDQGAARGFTTEIGVVYGPQNSQNEAIAKLWADSDRILDALENLVIAIGMGWDLDGVVGCAEELIRKHRT